ncbi:5-deoxy-glucuronate isomerase [uncultured Eubacterium sp.]|uniref:5-deoxy-glucuronate isomerase n=1 Tax=uncultured Eubacterium sp. TaxID=165185 RepID=UPI0025FD5C11|nr:5-deoxy-glucuronate isomerase [uncultured Eubacterium sp.]
MLYNPKYNEDGKKYLCRMNGENSDMLMDIYVKKLAEGETLTVDEDKNECAILLLRGAVNFTVGDSINEDCERANPFQKTPYAVHFSHGTKAVVTAKKESEVIVQMTDNERTWAPVFYNPDNCLYQEFGKGQWNGTGHRIVSTMFDLDNAPYSNMVMGEVFNQPGRWSSYPPHHHPQPEVYYYQFDHEEGFGAGFEGDTPYKTQNGSCLCIRGGNAHQQVTAPGFEMYYVWMIRHLDGDPWDKTRIYVPEYEWLANAD